MVWLVIVGCFAKSKHPPPDVHLQDCVQKDSADVEDEVQGNQVLTDSVQLFETFE